MINNAVRGVRIQHFSIAIGWEPIKIINKEWGRIEQQNIAEKVLTGRPCSIQPVERGVKLIEE